MHTLREKKERSLQGKAPARTHVSELRNTSPLPRGTSSLAIRYSREFYWAAVAGHASKRVHCDPRHLLRPQPSDTRLDLTGRPRSLLSAVRFALAIHHYQEGFPGQEKNQRKVLAGSTRSGGRSLSPSTVMAILERSSSPAAASVAVAALIALASVAGVAGEVFFQEKFDGKHPDLTRLFVVSGFPVLLSVSDLAKIGY